MHSSLTHWNIHINRKASGLWCEIMSKTWRHVNHIHFRCHAARCMWQHSGALTGRINNIKIMICWWKTSQFCSRLWLPELVRSPQKHSVDTFSEVKHHSIGRRSRSLVCRMRHVSVCAGVALAVTWFSVFSAGQTKLPSAATHVAVRANTGTFLLPRPS